MSAAQSRLILSLFPGIGLLDRGFEEAGFTVVRGPDPLWGGDVRRFTGPSHVFGGIIGGPPCQKFSLRNRKRDLAGGMELVNEYLRIVTEAQPDWWLMENVAGSPDFPAVTELGHTYAVQRFTLNASHVGSDQHRLRKFHYGRPVTAHVHGDGRAAIQPPRMVTVLLAPRLARWLRSAGLHRHREISRSRQWRAVPDGAGAGPGRGSHSQARHTAPALRVRLWAVCDGT